MPLSSQRTIGPEMVAPIGTGAVPIRPQGAQPVVPVKRVEELEPHGSVDVKNYLLEVSTPQGEIQIWTIHLKISLLSCIHEGEVWLHR